MNSLYTALGIALGVLTLVSVVFQVGRKVGRQEEHQSVVDAHLDRQDAEIAELHNKLDKLQP